MESCRVSTAVSAFVLVSRLVVLPIACAVAAVGCSDGGSAPAEPPAAVSSSTATLEWSRPWSNEDGSALTDLAGYKVYYGPEEYTPDHVLDVRGANVSKAEIQGLARGTWYFAITSYNSAGVESVKSGVVSTTL
jgi:hypothetical protein